MSLRNGLVLLLVFGLVSAAQAQTAIMETKDSLDVTLLRLNDDAGFVVYGEADSGSVPTTGAGVRMMWYPGRYAFRAGSVDGAQWDDASIGLGSAAFGTNNTASGDHSFVVGSGNVASGDESVAMGSGATASADRAFAFNGTASFVGAIALGMNAAATSDDAVALGKDAQANGLASIAIGASSATASFGVAIGTNNIASGNFSIALGTNASTANRQGSIVIGDNSGLDANDRVTPTANNQFVVRASGGVSLYTNQGLTSGVELAAGGSSWSAVSDRNRKEHFAAVDGEDVLARLRRVPVSTWNYTSQDASIRHMGPMAQDFHAAFGLGEDSLRINTIDIDGVNLAGVLGLERRTADLRAENEALRAELSALRAALAERETTLAAVQAEADALRAQQAEERAALEARLSRLEAALLQAAAAPAAGAPARGE